MYGERAFPHGIPLEMTEAAHYPGHMVQVKFSDLSTACMTEAQFDAIMDHAFEISKDW